MGIAIKIVLVIHLLGMGMIVGGALHQTREKAKKVTRVMLDGAYTQVLSGVILVALLPGLVVVATLPITAKFLVGVAVAVVGYVNRKKSNSLPAWATMLGLTLANVVIAVFWH